MNHALASTIIRSSYDRGGVLLVSDDGATTSSIDNILLENGYEIHVASNGKRAISIIEKKHIDFILIDMDSIDIESDELIYSIRIRVDEKFIPIVVLTSADDEVILSDCLKSGCDDFVLKPFTSTAILARLSSLDQARELKQLYKSSLNEQLVAKQILSYALSERHIEFEEIKHLSKSKAVFSGDLFLTSRRPDGCVQVLLADFTGHGLSAAIGALPVADIFSVMSTKGFEVSDILENLNNKLHTLLPVSMFMACIIIEINSKMNQVRIWNGGMPEIYIRGGITGKIKQKISSSHIPLGISDSSTCNFTPISVITDDKDQLILYSDGLTDAVNNNGEMFGQEHIEQCIENNNEEKSVFSHIVEKFNSYCGGVNPDDDVTLACVPCTNKLTTVDDNVSDENGCQLANTSNDGWCWYMELSGASLRNVNPVPIVLNEANKISGHSISEKKLTSVLTALYDNAIVHGISECHEKDTAKESASISRSVSEDDSYLRIGLRKVNHQGESALLVSIEDSGVGFDHVGLMDQLINRPENIEIINDGIPLVYEISDSLNYIGNGSRVEAIISGNV